MTEGKQDWYPMWTEIGIDIEKHDMLLSVLPNMFKEVYIESQKNRPNTMSFWDSIVGDIHGIRISELKKAKEKGKKIIGTFCLYVPDEILFALDCIGIGLCGGTNFSNYAVEDLLPTNICALIKSALGFGIGNICPYFGIADLLIGETTCDGKKKAWEILKAYKPVYVMETPQCKSRPQAKALFIQEMKDLIKELEKLTGKKLTTEKLKEAMQKFSKKRNQMKRVYETRKADPVPISGKDALLMSQVAFYDDPDRQIEMIGKLADEVELRIKEGIGVAEKDIKRILISGTPMAIPNWKMHHIIETKGAIIVAEETCTGTRYFQSEFNTVKSDTIEDLLDILADRYLGINCACFTPNDGRKEDILRLVKEYNADGVVLYTLNFCQAYEVEAINLEKEIKRAGIPVLSITTDYSSDDNEQLSTRIEAFLEMIRKH
ncbi:MAG: double-cubane-cluster-containing anaerobic reductase [Promethearchaeota archaeon]